MSKTTFDPNAKPVTLDENPAQRPQSGEADESPQAKAQKSSYKAFGASKWKAFYSAESPLESQEPSPIDQIGGVASAFGDSLNRAVNLGILGGAKPMSFAPRSPFDFSIQKTPKNEYLKYFKPVELPPTLSEAIGLFPDPADKDNLQLSIDETRTHYKDYLAMFEERKATAENFIKGGKLKSSDIGVVRQFVKKLEKAINFTQDQLAALDRYEKDQIGGGE